MVTTAMYLVVAAMGINYGWQPVEPQSQDYEYVVQIEPELLDAIAKGQTLDLESHVPAEIHPIRRVRITVGKSELPRQLVFKPADKVQTAAHEEQQETSAAHTAQRPEDDAWSSDAPSSGATANQHVYPQFGPSIGRTAPSKTPTPEPVVDRFEDAVRETGRTLRDAVEYGAEQTGEQFQRSGGQALRSLEEAGTGLGTRLDDARRNLQTSIAEPFGTDTSQAGFEADGGPAPAWRSDRGWTTLTPDVAAPPLANPALDSYAPRDWTFAADEFKVNSDTWDVQPAGNSEPQDPRLRERSVVSRGATPGPRDQSQPRANGSPAPVDRYSDSSWPERAREEDSSLSGMVPVRKNSSAPAPSAGLSRSADNKQESIGWPDDGFDSKPPRQTPPTLTDRTRRAPADDRYAMDSLNERQPSSSGNWRDLPASTPATERGPTLTPPALPPADPPVAETSGRRAAADRSPSETPTNVSAKPSASQPQTTKSEPVPWMPFLAVSVALVGSFGANVFLGWSYLDARQRYKTMIRDAYRPNRHENPRRDYEDDYDEADDADDEELDEDDGEENEDRRGNYQATRRRRERRHDR